jgi:hypothetical protein
LCNETRNKIIIQGCEWASGLPAGRPNTNSCRFSSVFFYCLTSLKVPLARSLYNPARYEYMTVWK